VALCRSIEERALPEAHDRMLHLITTQAPEAIGNLRFLADNGKTTSAGRSPRSIMVCEQWNSTTAPD
jgi:hypothetical protein